MADRRPTPFPENGIDHVNVAQTDAELHALRRCVARGAPFGAEPWQNQTATALGLQSALRPRGRPNKKTNRRCRFNQPDPHYFLAFS